MEVSIELNAEDLINVIGKNMNRREEMIQPFFKGDNIPDDPRTIRLMNEVMSSQTGDATQLLGIYEQKKNGEVLDSVRDMMSDIMRMPGVTPREVDVPILTDRDLPIDNVEKIEEGSLIELRTYLDKDE